MQITGLFKKIFTFIGLGFLLLLVTAVLMFRGMGMGLQRSLQNKFYDTDSASPKIVIVAIDEKSLQDPTLGPFSNWTREHYAWAIAALLRGAEAAVVGVDVTFPDDKEGDDRLAEVLKEFPGRVVMAGRYFFENSKQQFELPNATLQTSDPAVGLINVVLDEDGFVRQIPAFIKTPEGVREAFSLAIARKYQNKEPVSFDLIKNEFAFAENVRIPVMEKEGLPLMHLNYFAAPNRFRQISFIDILNERPIDKQGNRVELKDKIVLIGPTAMDLQDHYLAPTSEGVKMAGVEIHANAIQTVLEQAFLREQSRLSLWLVLLGILVVNVILFSFLRLRYALPLALLEAFGILVAGIVAYEFQVFLNVVYPIVMALLSFTGVFLLRFMLEQKERKFLQNAFGHYVNKAVVDQIVKHPEMLGLGGARREITLFFSDIRGFTTISEKMKPDELVPFLNEYLQEMTEIILKHEGTLDKYEGDGMMAFWGAPIAQHEHAKKACLAALENQARLKELRKKWAKEGKPEIHIRIGLNTGDAIVGNMGSRDRFDYTATGDNVNLASRLEGINKQYGTGILLSESTYEKVKTEFVCRELDLIRVKGKEKPVRIYELLSEITNSKSQILNNFQILNSNFQNALKLYRQKQFKEARAAFAELQDDPAAQTFVERCDEFLKNPPPTDWDGVWTFTTK